MGCLNFLDEALHADGLAAYEGKRVAKFVAQEAVIIDFEQPRQEIRVKAFRLQAAVRPADKAAHRAVPGPRRIRRRNGRAPAADPWRAPLAAWASFHT